MRLIPVVGLQFGSEAKGHVTHALVRREIERERNVVNVRVAGPNAGHTVYDAKGKKFALRQVPIGIVESDVHCVIAPGSEVDPEVLFHEIDLLDDSGYDVSRIMVDVEATVLTVDDIKAETGMHERMGSTGKGIGAARAARIMRTAARVKDNKDLVYNLGRRGVAVGDTVDMIHATDAKPNPHLSVVIEGTQGYGLGLNAGFYPQCTSSNCRAVDFIAMAGLSPWQASVEVWGVARVFPIRVAGNSGPLYAETTWEALGLPEERTTVTQKVRRVGGWDDRLVGNAIRANGTGTHSRLQVALTMLDQDVPAVANKPLEKFEPDEIECVVAWDRKIRGLGGELAMVTTGPTTASFL